MIQVFEVETPRSVDELLELLLQTLGLGFSALDNGWRSESYGGSVFTLTRESATRYELRIAHDPAHQHFRDQQTTFCRVEMFPDWIPEALSREGVRCRYTGTEEPS